MSLTIDWSANLILVNQPKTTVTVQEIHDFARAQEATSCGICLPAIVRSSGKELLGAGVAVGVTVALQSPWQIKFADGNYIAAVTGGNLVGGPGGDPIAYSPGVQTLLLQSAASTVVTTGGTSLTAEQAAQLEAIAKLTGNKVTASGDTITIFEADGVTPWRVYSLAGGGRVQQ